MKKYILLSIFSILSVLLIVAACTGGNTGTVKAGSVSYIVDTFVGDVTLSHDAGNNWSSVEVGMVLREDDMIKTGKDSSVDIIMPDRGIFRVADESIIHLKKLATKLEQIAVKKGKLFVNVTEKLQGDESFKVETEVAVVAIRGTQFSVETDGEVTTTTVVEGKVQALENINVEGDVEAQKSVEDALEVEVSSNQVVAFDKKSKDELEKQINDSLKKSGTNDLVNVAKEHRKKNQPKRTQAMKKDKDVWDQLTKEEKKALIKEKLEEIKLKKEEEKKDKEMLNKAMEKARGGKESLADKYVGEEQTSTAEDQKNKEADKLLEKYKQKQGQNTTEPQANDADDLIKNYKKKSSTTSSENSDDSGSLIDKYKKKKSQ